MLEMVSLTGLPISEGLESVWDLPHTISTAIQYRARINSFRELPKEKQPPRNLWDKPYRLNEFFDDMFNNKSSKNSDGFDYIEYNSEDVE